MLTDRFTRKDRRPLQPIPNSTTYLLHMSCVTLLKSAVDSDVMDQIRIQPVFVHVGDLGLEDIHLI